MHPIKKLILVFTAAFMTSAYAADTLKITITGQNAKNIYNSLTGKKVQAEGAAGHLYRKGQNIVCRYTDVEITQKGKSVPMNDPSRYVCGVRFNKNGVASSDESF